MPGMMCIVTNGQESPAGGEVFVSPFSDEGIEAWRGGMAHLESQHWKWPSWHSKPGFKLQICLTAEYLISIDILSTLILMNP